MDSRKLDKKETAYKVRKFLTKDFQTYLNYSGKHRADLRSPIMDKTGVTAHGVNNQEKKMTRGVDAEYAVRAITHTIGDLTDSLEGRKPQPYKTIIYRCYVARMYDKQISNYLNYSKTQYGALKKEALVEFAERFEYWKVKDHATDLPDLRCWLSKNKLDMNQ